MIMALISTRRSAPCDCGAVPCGTYLWDHRNASLRAWLGTASPPGRAVALVFSCAFH